MAGFCHLTQLCESARVRLQRYWNDNSIIIRRQTFQVGSEKDTNRIHNQFSLSTSSDFKASFVGPTNYTILVGSDFSMNLTQIMSPEFSCFVHFCHNVVKNMRLFGLSLKYYSKVGARKMNLFYYRGFVNHNIKVPPI